MWQTVQSLKEIPHDRDLRIAVMEGKTVHALVFPCRLRGEVWVDAKTGRQVDVYPTHWQDWTD
jgi:hypothetical protein